MRNLARPTQRRLGVVIFALATMWRARRGKPGGAHFRRRRRADLGKRGHPLRFVQEMGGTGIDLRRRALLVSPDSRYRQATTPPPNVCTARMPTTKRVFG